MDRSIDLLRYLPPYLKEYEELKHIMMSENPEFHLLVENRKKVLNNTFILYTDKDGIQRFEKMLHLVPSEGDTLELRQSKALIAWNNDIPYVLKALYNKLIALQGNDNIQIILNDYTITITTHMDKRGQTEPLWDLFESMIPENMQIVHSNIVEYKTSGNVYIAAGMNYSKLTGNEHTE